MGMMDYLGAKIASWVGVNEVAEGVKTVQSSVTVISIACVISSIAILLVVLSHLGLMPKLKRLKEEAKEVVKKITDEDGKT